jgi:hypothetical protein
VHAIEKVEAGGIQYDRSPALLFRTEEEGGAKDALKALNDNRNEVILTKGQPETRVPDDIKGEVTIAA